MTDASVALRLLSPHRVSSPSTHWLRCANPDFLVAPTTRAPTARITTTETAGTDARDTLVMVLRDEPDLAVAVAVALEPPEAEVVEVAERQVTAQHELFADKTESDSFRFLLIARMNTSGEVIVRSTEDIYCNTGSMSISNDHLTLF